MTRILFILGLILHSCNSGNSNTEVKQDTLNHVKNEQSQTNVTSITEVVDSNFLIFWKEFIGVVKSSNLKIFKLLSFDSLDCEHKSVHVNDFNKAFFFKVFDDTLKNRLTDSSKVNFDDEEITATYLSRSIIQQVKDRELIKMKKVNITKVDKYPEGPMTIVLEFIETKNGYKFYGYDKFG